MLINKSANQRLILENQTLKKRIEEFVVKIVNLQNIVDSSKRKENPKLNSKLQSQEEELSELKSTLQSISKENSYLKDQVNSGQLRIEDLTKDYHQTITQLHRMRDMMKERDAQEDVWKQRAEKMEIKILQLEMELNKIEPVNQRIQKLKDVLGRVFRLVEEGSSQKYLACLMDLKLKLDEGVRMQGVDAFNINPHVLELYRGIKDLYVLVSHFHKNLANVI